MTKNIIFKNGISKEMTFEEVMVTFKKLVIKIAKKYKGLRMTEDDIQEGYLALWKAYETYNEIHCFSTHATWVLMSKFAHLVSYETSPVRDTTDKKFVSLDYTFEDGGKVEELISDVNSDFHQSILDSELLLYIKSNLTDFEIELLAFNTGYITCKYICEKHELSKSCVSNRNARFKVKLRKLIEVYNGI